MKTYAGIDCGKWKTTVVVLDLDDGGLWERISLHHLVVPASLQIDGADQGKHLMGMKAAEVVPLDARVSIEPALVAGARNLQSSLAVAETVGAVMAHLPERGITKVAVSSWKKAVVGHGGADKKQVREWVRQSHPKVAELIDDLPRAPERQDAYDAFCICLYGLTAQ